MIKHQLEESINYGDREYLTMIKQIHSLNNRQQCHRNDVKTKQMNETTMKSAKHCKDQRVFHAI